MRSFDGPEQQREVPPTPGISRERWSTTGPHGLELARKALRGLVSSFFIVHYVITFLYISFCARVFSYRCRSRELPMFDASKFSFSFRSVGSSFAPLVYVSGGFGYLLVVLFLLDFCACP